MARPVDPNNVRRRIERLTKQIAKLESKKSELSALKVKLVEAETAQRTRVTKPVSVDKLKAQLARQKREQNRIKRLIEEAESQETASQEETFDKTLELHM